MIQGLVYSLTRSPVLVAAVYASLTVPFALFMFIGGPLADRLNRQANPPLARHSAIHSRVEPSRPRSQIRRDEKRAATADLVLLLKRRPEVITFGKSQTERAPALFITFSVKTAVSEQPFYSSFGSRHVANGTCPDDDFVSPRQQGRR